MASCPQNKSTPGNENQANATHHLSTGKWPRLRRFVDNCDDLFAAGHRVHLRMLSSGMVRIPCQWLDLVDIVRVEYRSACLRSQPDEFGQAVLLDWPLASRREE